ncbi:hypothetical protein [uncultured Tateyamaria sp.]|uniref:hypothetical protein n=1 Tax=uncultured Tateyamaria sp. TaxID=455651 RepID=UPI00262456F9|nr:hypothetical protein [uncultured Tateyamaria sp.]
MKLRATKTPLLIAAIATAITLTGFAPVQAANPVWITADAETAQVIDANFKYKKHHYKKHHYKKHSYKKHHYGYGGYKKKHHVKKKIILKKFF